MNGVFKIDAAGQLAGKPSMMNPDAQKMSTGHDHGSMDMKEETAGEHAMITVYGNCEMCKERIEKAAPLLLGVSFANWEAETKMFHLNYCNGVSIVDFHHAVAQAGPHIESE